MLVNSWGKWSSGWLIFAVLLVSACESSWLGGREDPPLPGERISILSLEQRLDPDPGLSGMVVRLPKPYVNKAWPQQGGYPSHAMHHLALGDSLVQLWRTEVGEGSGKTKRIINPPVVAEGMLLVYDAEANVAAFDALNGKRLWRVNLTPEHEEVGTLGGGLAYDEGRLFATTGYGEVVAIDPSTGSILWRHKATGPIRAGPTAAGGRIFVVGLDNQLHVLTAKDGRLIWTHVGIEEPATLLGAASPAVEGDLAIVPYSSGEVFALRVENGRVAWADSLSAASAATSTLASLSDINGAPVIDRDRVLVISHSGLMISLDFRTGQQVWDQTIGGLETPWVAGNFIYVVTTEGALLCLSRKDGRIRWVKELPRFANTGSQSETITWEGPILAGDRLVLAASHGFAVSVSPYTGELLGVLELGAPIVAAPIIANKVLYLLTEHGYLIALR